MRIAWIGLGTMGAPMAGHLLAAGHEMHVHNRTREREELLATAGASRAASPAEAADGADLVFTCVSDSPDLEAVVLGPTGAAASMRPGAVLVDCSTVAPGDVSTDRRHAPGEEVRRGRCAGIGWIRGRAQGDVDGVRRR